MSILLLAVIGVAAGFIASKIMQTELSMVETIAIGLLGAVIGGFIGFGLWIFGGTALENATPEWQDTIAGIGGSAPLAVAAASASTLVLGMLHEGFRSRSN